MGFELRAEGSYLKPVLKPKPQALNPPIIVILHTVVVVAISIFILMITMMLILMIMMSMVITMIFIAAIFNSYGALLEP